MFGSSRASSARTGETHRSATSNVLGMTASRSWSSLGCQQVSIEASMHARSVGKPNGSFERHRKQAVRLFMRNGTGSIAASSLSVVMSAIPTPVALPWLSGDRSSRKCG